MKYVFAIIVLVIALIGLDFVVTPKNKSIEPKDFKVFRNQKEKLNPLSKTSLDDLDGDSALEKYTLELGRLKVEENNKIIWQSSSEWWIDDFALADSANDGIKDLNLSVWKSGSFGRSKPFWIKENDLSIKNHFFVFDFRDKKIKAVWQSSNLKTPNCTFRFEDVDNDGQQDLIVTEGDYATVPDCQGKYLAVWKWNGWGFSNEQRSELKAK